MTTTHLTSKIEPLLDAEKALLYFTASWCGPCKTFGPIVEQFQNKNQLVKVIKVDVDENRELAQLYSVRSVPTIIAFNFGDERGRHSGLTTEATIETLIG